MNRLQGKDLINIGIFTAIYFIVIFAAASIGFIPIFIPLISVIVPLVGGIPMMLFFSKIKKFGMLTIKLSFPAMDRNMQIRSWPICRTGFCRCFWRRPLSADWWAA